MTRIWRRSTRGSSSSAFHTYERSASPEYVGGVWTQMNRTSVSARSAASSVYRIRARFRSSTSGRSGSWNGRCPACSAAIRSGTMSRTTTSCPSSAKQPPVTSPTQPAPKIPTVRVSVMPARRSLPTEWSEPLRDREHRLVRERVEDRVRHPVGRAVLLQHDHVQVRAGVVEVVRPAADPMLEAGAVEDRRVVPVGLLDPPVLVLARLERQAHADVVLVHAVHTDRRERLGTRVAFDQTRHLELELDEPPDGAEVRQGRGCVRRSGVRMRLMRVM